MSDTFQVQITRDGHTWIPQQPGEHGLTRGGDHWFTDFEKAWVAANLLRNNLTWSEVRIVHRDEDGNITREQTIL